MKLTLTCLIFILSATILLSCPPVKWGQLHVSQQKNNLHLNWTTQAENNNKLFVVQRSADAENWNSIAEIPAEMIAAAYSHVDKNPLPNANFYRIKQVDFNGDFSYSATAFMGVSATNAVKIAPNPATAFANVDNVEVGNFVKVTDAQGKLYLQEEITTTSFVLETAFLPKGMYFVIFEDKSNKVINTQKLIIQ